MSPVAAITGATKGLGLALACELAAHGWIVAGCGSSAASVAAAAAQGGAVYASSGGADASTPPPASCVVDVTDAAAVATWAAAIPVPDLVIANAGVVNAPAPIWDL